MHFATVPTPSEMKTTSKKKKKGNERDKEKGKKKIRGTTRRNWNDDPTAQFLLR